VPSGKFVREKDRKDNAGYGRTEKKGAAAGDDVMDIKVHTGRFEGHLFKSLSKEDVQKLATNWKPEAEKKEKPSADDKRLLAALAEWDRREKAANDQIPMDY
jgi:hypothetical protein